MGGVMFSRMAFGGAYRRGGFRVRLSVCVVAASVAVGCLLPGVSLAARWVIQRTLNAPGIATDWLSAVSCPSARECFTVGYSQLDVPPSGVRALIERWNGLRWSIRMIRTVSYLTDVSCTSSVACTAVGPAAAMRWNGRRWSLQPGGAGAGVSCPALEACTSVGRDPSDLDLSQSWRWDGVTWSTQSTPRILAATDVGLRGVSCPSTRVCFAVGSYARLGGPGGGYHPLVERWNGTKWSIQTTPKLTSGFDSLADVACPSPSACTAVGRTNIRNHGTLVERWNGTKWSIQPTPAIRIGASQLTGVSCSSKIACIAVGWSEFRDQQRMIVERWNGTAWSIESTPVNGILTGVSCSSATACTAVGTVHDLTLAMRWNGVGRNPTRR
jgi:hypothetical protein